MRSGTPVIPKATKHSSLLKQVTTNNAVNVARAQAAEVIGHPGPSVTPKATSSQAELMSALCPRSKCDWYGTEPTLKNPDPEFPTTFNGFITGEELAALEYVILGMSPLSRSVGDTRSISLRPLV